ncbi:MAG: ABC-F family ATP-binding cassette domain-containing protein [Acutalibacteraceae bacterium]
MGLLEIINISHSFGDKILYKNASFELFKGEHMGIVGENGAGKTTLMNSLSGKIIPDVGEIRIQKGIKVGYLDQHAEINKDISIFDYLKTAFDELYEIDNKLKKIYDNMAEDNSEEILNKASDYQSLLVNRGFYEIESSILKVSDGLGITSFGMESKLKNLSGGQRAKVILAKLLLENPDVLLLDEPTNFLDTNHIIWLTDYLKNFKNAFIVISHDFEFLDKITNCICNIEFNNIKKYAGNFSKFVKNKEMNRVSYEREFKAQQKEINKLETYIQKNKVRASTAKQAKSRQKVLDKMDRLSAPKDLEKPHFTFKSAPVSSGKAMIIKNLEVGYNNKPILPKINLEILNGDKIAVVGFNGIGKSTLLKTLMGIIPPVKGYSWTFDTTRIGYFEQELIWEDGSCSPLEIIRDKFPKLSQKDARSCLARCAVSSKEVLEPIRSLSGGEQAKVKICILMLTNSNFLILDEPTNHLDVLAKEALKEQLKLWEGTLLLVSHDRQFYGDICKKVIDIEKIM